MFENRNNDKCVLVAKYNIHVVLVVIGIRIEMTFIFVQSTLLLSFIFSALFTGKKYEDQMTFGIKIYSLY